MPHASLSAKLAASGWAYASGHDFEDGRRWSGTRWITEPYSVLTESGASFTVVFIADPDAFAERSAVDVTTGWHIERASRVGIAYVPDFEREYALAPCEEPGPE